MPHTPEPHHPTETGSQPQDADPEFSDSLRNILPASVLALGQRIIAEFQAASDSLLTRWMAYRIAELMHASGTAGSPQEREAAASQCADLILQLWEHRSDWPTGWPPPTAAGVADALRERSHPYEKFPVPADEASLTWLATLQFANGCLEEEATLWQLAALADENPDDIRAWTDQEGTELGESEAALLEAILESSSTAPELLASHLTAGKARRQDIDVPVTRASAVVARLKSLATMRLRVAEKVADAITAKTVTGNGGTGGD